MREDQQGGKEVKHLLFEQISNGILVADAQTKRFVAANPAICRMFGYAAAELLKLDVSRIHPPEALALITADFEAIARGIRHVSPAAPCLRKDGSVFYADIATSHTTIGGRHRLIGIFTDVTARLQAERRQTLALTVLSILNEPKSLREDIERILSAMQQTTGFTAVGLRLKMDGDFPYFMQKGFSADFLRTEKSLMARATDGTPCRDPSGQIRLACMCGLVLSGQIEPANPLMTPGGSFWCNETARLTQLPDKLKKQLRLRNRCIQDFQSVALIPLRSGQGEIIGLLQFNDRRAHLFTLEMIQFFEGLGVSIGVAVDRRKTEKLVALLKQTIDVHVDGAYWFDWQNKVIYVNAAGCRALGYGRAELLGKSMHDLTPDATGPDLNHAWEQLRRDGHLTLETRQRRKDGHLFPVEISATYVQFGGQEYRCDLVRDISERKAVQQRLSVLTAREREVLEHIMAGQLNKQIAADLGITEATIKTHRAHVMQKMAVQSVAALVQLVSRAGLVYPGTNSVDPGAAHPREVQVTDLG